MTRPVALRPEARAEAHRAKAWYEEQVPGLGNRFVLALDAAIEAIGQRPEAFPKVYGEVRQCLVRRFPYTVYFRIALVLAAIGCGGSGEGRPEESEPLHHWRMLYRDAEYQVSLDTAHVEPGPEAGAYLVWYETKHTAERREAGKPWNREVIRSLLRCSPLAFKTVRITLHQDDGPVVAVRGGDGAAVADTPWKTVRFPSVDQAAMSEACLVIERSKP